MADVFFGAHASTALAKYQCFVLAPVTDDAFTWFPLCIHDVVRLPGCPVILLPDWPCWVYKLRAMLVCAATLKSMGSE